MSKICPKCGYEGNSKFCPECGAEMIERGEPAKENLAVSSEPQLKSPSKKGIRTWSKKKKIFAGIGIFFLAFIVIFVIVAINTPQEKVDNMQKRYIEEENRDKYSYSPIIEACGFKIDNTEMKLLVSKEDNGFYAFDDLENINYEFIMLSYDPEGSKLEEEANKLKKYEEDEGEAKDISEIRDIEINGYKSKVFTYYKKNYYAKEYAIDKADDNLIVVISIQSFVEDDLSKLDKMVETMEIIKPDKDEDKSNEEPKEETTKPKEEKKENSDTKKSDNNTKIRKIENMDDDEIFMVMALAEKEIKNHLTYDAKKAKFSHQPEDWYMSEQDGYYTVTTTFEAPNEYGTMQKAGAVVSFTVTSKNKDGWGYKDEDVFIEWK